MNKEYLITMINRSNTFGEEVADQVGIFLSVVTGFIVAQGWNQAIKDTAARHKSEDNEHWYPWVYALVATVIALLIMTIWGYFVASRIYKHSVEMSHMRNKSHQFKVKKYHK